MTKTQARAANDNDRLEDTTLESFSRTLSTRLGADASFAERPRCGISYPTASASSHERDLAFRWGCVRAF